MCMALPQIQVGDGMLGSALLASVDIVQQLNHHWWCTVVCRQTSDQRLEVEEYLGKDVVVKTTDDAGVETIHFTGFVLDVELNYEVWGSYGATLRAVSHSYKLDVTARKQYYSAQTLSAVASIVAGRDGVPVSVSAGGSKALNYVQYGETDYSFLHRIADDYGAWIRPKDTGMEIQDSFQAGTTLGFRDVDGLISFKLRGSMAPTSYSGSHYDFHSMSSNSFSRVQRAPALYDGASRLTSAVQAASAKLPTGFEPQRSRAMTLGNYEDQLHAESERSMGAAVVGLGESRHQALQAGNTVALDGLIDAKGTYGVIRVDHHWTPQGYSNTFACTPWKQYRNPTPPPARLWSGIVPARVTAHNDPKKMGRVQVQFFWQDEGNTHWARATSPHAGPDRGFMFMPEVGDEVAVAFEDGDPERPIIIGSLWNGVHQAPRFDFFGDDIEPNNVKRILTKAGNRLQIVDEPGNETIVLATPNHSSITLSETLQGTKRTNIAIQSDGDITLAAPNGRVHIIAKIYTREVG